MAIENLYLMDLIHGVTAPHQRLLATWGLGKVKQSAKDVDITGIINKMTVGTKFQQVDFTYQVQIEQIITRKGQERLSTPVYVMKYIGIDKPNFTTNEEQIKRTLHWERWIELKQ